MRPLDRSYGDNSKSTRSPNRMFMLNLRILPLISPIILMSLSSSLTLNVALGMQSVTLPVTVKISSLAILIID